MFKDMQVSGPGRWPGRMCGRRAGFQVTGQLVHVMFNAQMAPDAFSTSYMDGIAHFVVGRQGLTPPPFGTAATSIQELGLGQALSYSSWRRHHMLDSLRPSGARSSHGYMPHRASSPREYVE